MSEEKIVWSPKRKPQVRESVVRNELIECIKKDPTLSAAELAEMVGVTRATVYNHLREFHVDNQK